jgi:AAA15 family ATPase/GTPase
LCKLYQDLTNIEILSSHPQKMGDVKFRNDFSTNKNGVDSNTISAGEDNILIVLTALISLKYYFETLTQTESDVESLLVIDEFDATLHPALQVRLLELCRQYSRQYKIQIIATTHSLSLIEYALQQGDNVIYLKENLQQVDLMPEPDITKIKMDLKTLARKDIYEGKKIPIFTEDAQARCFLNIILDYWSEKDRAFLWSYGLLQVGDYLELALSWGDEISYPHG